MENILKISQFVKSRYPLINYDEKIKKSKFNSLHDIEKLLFSNNSISDCGSTLFGIILYHYFDDNDVFNRKNEYDIFSYPNPTFYTWFSQDKSLSLQLWYLEYTPFYQLNCKDFNLITNNMGYWMLRLGKSKEIYYKYNSMWYGEYQPNEFCYLVFWNKPNKMIITTINYIQTELVKNAKEDFELSVSKYPKDFHDTIRGLYHCTLKINNINEETTKLWFAGSLFKKDKKSLINFCNMLENKATYLLNDIKIDKIAITNNN